MFYSVGQIVPGLMETLVFSLRVLAKKQGRGYELTDGQKESGGIAFDHTRSGIWNKFNKKMNGANHQMNAVILPGVHIGDGAIIGANSVVGSDIEPYTIVVGNPARVLRKRFDDEMIDLMLRFKWWDKSIEEIDRLIPILTCSDLEKVREELKARL